MSDSKEKLVMFSLSQQFIKHVFIIFDAWNMHVKWYFIDWKAV